jgi:hypothetical protein
MHSCAQKAKNKVEIETLNVPALSSVVVANRAQHGEHLYTYCVAFDSCEYTKEKDGKFSVIFGRRCVQMDGEKFELKYDGNKIFVKKYTLVDYANSNPDTMFYPLDCEFRYEKFERDKLYLYLDCNKLKDKTDTSFRKFSVLGCIECSLKR